MSEKTLKFDIIKFNEKEFHKSKQPINLDLVNIDQIVNLTNLNIMMMTLSILLVTKKIILLSRCVLFYLKSVDTKNALKTEEKTCLS